jgi:uncharacterized RDD family membrane protein YckC
MASAVLSNRAYVETPESVRLAFRLAGPGTRAGAYAVDLGIRTAALYAIITVFSIVLFPLAETGVPTGVYFVVAFVLEWGYGCLFETFWNGQTPGKRAFHLRVINVEGYPIGFYEAMLRNLLRAADFVPVFYGVGFLVASTSERMQRIGDIVAGTMVIRERRGQLRRDPEGLQEYEPLPPSAFHHRYRPSEKTLDVVESLFRRRNELSAARVDEIAHVLSEPLGRRLSTTELRREARQAPADMLFRILRTFRRPSGSDTESPR